LIGFYNKPDLLQFVSRKAEIPRQLNRLDPILRGATISINVHMMRLIRFMAEPIKSIRSVTKYGWHEAAQ
jgi:hypothetical protein